MYQQIGCACVPRTKCPTDYAKECQYKGKWPSNAPSSAYMSLFKSKSDTNICRCLLVNKCLPGYRQNRRSSSLRQLLAEKEFSHQDSSYSDESALTQMRNEIVPYDGNSQGRRGLLQCLNIYKAGKLVCKAIKSCCSSSARTSCQRRGRYYYWDENACACRGHNQYRCVAGDYAYRCCASTGLKPRMVRRRALQEERPIRSLLHRRCKTNYNYYNTYYIPRKRVYSGCDYFCCGRRSSHGGRQCNDDDD